MAQADKPDQVAQAQVERPVPGKPLPEGFVNPPRGSTAHRCVDRKGIYQPSWWQLNLRRPEGLQADFEYFQLNSEKYYIPYNAWCNVPPSVVEILQSAKSDVLESKVNQATGEYDGDLTRPGETMKVIDVIPAFNYTLLPSA